MLETKHKKKSGSVTFAFLEIDSDPLDVKWDTLERQANTKPLLQVFLVNTQWIKTVGSEQEIETKTQNFVRLKIQTIL